MVMEHLLLILSRVTFQTSAILFALCLTYIISSLFIFFLNIFIKRIKSLARRSIFDILYRYMFKEIQVKDIQHRRLQREVLIDAFLTIISLITGEKQKHMKRAVAGLGLIDVIKRGLVSIFSSKRMRSCYMLGLLRSKRTVDNLTLVLFDSNSRVASSAIIALGEIGEIHTVQSIMRFFRVSSYANAWLIAAVLPFFGEQIYKEIRPYFKLDLLPRNKLLLLIKVAASLKLAESLKELINVYTESGNLDVKINALIAIGKVNDLSALKTVLDALSDEVWQIRAVACNIVGEMTIKGAAFKLIPMLTDRNWFIRKNAAGALGKLGKIGIHSLLACLDTDDRYARDMIVQTLEESGVVEQAVTDIMSGDSEKKGEASEIIWALINKGYKELLGNYSDSCEFIHTMISDSGKA